MSTKEKAPTSAATLAEAAETATCSRAAISCSDYSTRKGPISRYLLEGRENALHLQDLVKITGWTEREVRQQIHQERRQGVPILSDNVRGYFFSADENERAHCIRSLRHRANEILKAAKAIEGDTAHIEGQVMLDV